MSAATQPTSHPTSDHRQQKPAREWLSRKEAANYLTSIGHPITEKTLSNKASNHNTDQGGGPSFTRIGWNFPVQYRRADLDAWAAKQKTFVP